MAPVAFRRISRATLRELIGLLVENCFDAPQIIGKQETKNKKRTGIVDISDLVGYNAGSLLLSKNQGSNSSLSVLINPNATLSVPEPATFAIFAFAAVALASLRSRR